MSSLITSRVLVSSDYFEVFVLELFPSSYQVFISSEEVCRCAGHHLQRGSEQPVQPAAGAADL